MTNDLISRAALFNSLANVKTLEEAFAAIQNAPETELTLYGYKIEHLAYIARVMQKEGVTAEYAVRTFDDMSRALKMIIDEAREAVEKQLEEIYG